MMGFLMPSILVTNDDGVHAEGIRALADALRPLGDVTIVAPIQEASAIGHALTLRRRSASRQSRRRSSPSTARPRTASTSPSPTY
jgi:5'/3'-nucleotidase SurE